MEWSKLYEESKEPSAEDINNFIGSDIWLKLNSFIQETYNILPRLSYSKCSMQRGWNIKYKKGGKALCTLYPMPGYFIALIVIAEQNELFIPVCSDYVKKLYGNTSFSAGGKWLMIEVTDPQIFEDVKSLIQFRVKPREK